MLFKKKFKAIDRRITVLNEWYAKELVSNKKRNTKILKTQNKVNAELIDQIKELQKQVKALVQSHPNRKVYDGVYESLKEKK